ncbi:hypothetical protein N7471_002455 [Penicillium samsonianum]|uniref:uncharacterized protein n=1 Tax=Penicillium samsonianum TaxID=1882272 RepID=UPI00254890CF|nr:uncharacterized protein N7471_002455 [Penicillium samsonianum]KAJ6143002.1 hypothetical protein N7471_002455 [Penicillium samsonianum]
MDPRQSFPLPVAASSPTTSTSPTDSIPSISPVPSLTYSHSTSSSASKVPGTPTLTIPIIPKEKLGKSFDMASDIEGNRNQLARTMSQLAEAGFRPVWSREHGYPGTIPEDIGEYIDSNSYRFDELIGPLSSLFWLAGLDELVDAIYDPAIALQDEVRLIPINVGVPWILEHLFEEEKLPASLYDRYFFGYDEPPVVIMPVVRLDPIPPQIGYQYACHRLEELFPTNRPQRLPQDIATVRVKGDKNKDRLSMKISKDYVSKLGGGSFLYRVSSRAALAAMMAFFTPVIQNRNLDNELGPGIYTSDSLEWVLKFGSVNSALLVFRDPDFRNLDVWRPSMPEWQHIIATWTRKSLSNVPDSVPLEWRTADVIQGPISKPNPPKNCIPEPGDVSQTVAVSYAGCGALSASLAMIIWLE